MCVVVFLLFRDLEFQLLIGYVWKVCNLSPSFLFPILVEKKSSCSWALNFISFNGRFYELRGISEICIYRHVNSSHRTTRVVCHVLSLLCSATTKWDEARLHCIVNYCNDNGAVSLLVEQSKEHKTIQFTNAIVELRLPSIPLRISITRT